ncbi:protein FAM107B isoform X2 [Acipenser oxyrinchus oxyrinchus]|uniref:Protein FAM107B isoform X2 n=1 Tax=Acipenser oxyrinchus oxyrinchus TaxID=40147 RepID=A0AAD8CJU1_ACIOX|nr:protein FAM107B isoform X2 [Acipenser oxyrinchus oxyrinchus]
MPWEQWLLSKSHILVSLKLVRTMKAGCGTSEQTASRESDATQEDGTNFIPIKTPAAIPPSKLANPVRVSRTHQDLHKELLLAHKKGLCVTSKPELQLVLERRKKEQTQREEGELGRSPLEKEMLKRQQRHQQLERVQAKGGTENHFEFVVVKENLRKTSRGEQGPSAPAL